MPEAEPQLIKQALSRRSLMLEVASLTLVSLFAGLGLWRAVYAPGSKVAFWIFAPLVLVSLAWLLCEVLGCFVRESDSGRMRKTNLAFGLLSGLCLAATTTGLFLSDS